MKHVSSKVTSSNPDVAIDQSKELDRIGSVDHFRSVRVTEAIDRVERDNFDAKSKKSVRSVMSVGQTEKSFRASDDDYDEPQMSRKEAAVYI